MPSWYLISDGISKGAVFLSLLGGSNLLGAKEYGELVFFSLLVSGISLQLGMRVHVAYEAYFAKLDEKERSSYFVSCACITFTVAAFQYLLGLPFVFFLELEYLPSLVNWALINLVALSLYMNQLFQTLFIMSERVHRYSAVVIINSFVFVTSFLYFCYHMGSGISYLYGYLCAGTVSLLLSIFLALDFLSLEDRGVRDASRKILAFCVGLIPHQVSNFLQGNFDRILVTVFFTKTELGVYGLAQQIAQILQLMVIAINKAYYPKAYMLLPNSAHVAELSGFFNWKRRFEVVFIGVGLVSAVVLPSIFLFLSEEFQAGKLITLLLVLAFVCDALYYTNSVVLFRYEKTRTISVISAVLLVFYCCAGVLVGSYADNIVFFAVATLSVFFLQSCIVRFVAYDVLRKNVVSVA